MAIGASRFELRAEAGQYVGEINKASGATKALSKSQTDIGKSAKEAESSTHALSKKFDSGRESANKFAKYVALAGVAMVAGLVKAGIQSAGALADTSAKLGIATEKLAGLEHAAILGGVSASTMDKSIEKLGLNLVKASAGTGSAVKALDALGLSAKDLLQLSPDERMGKIADALGRVDGAAAKTKIAFDLFGKSGAGLTNVLKDGSAGLAAMQKDAELAGLALSAIDASMLEQAGDEMDRVAQQTKGFSQQLALKFTPLIAAASEALFDMGGEAGGMAVVAGKAFDYVLKGVGVMANGIQALTIGWSGMKVALQTAALAIGQGLDKIASMANKVWNAMPWTDKTTYTSMFSGFTATMESELQESEKRVRELLAKPLASNRLEEFNERAQKSFRDKAKTAVESEGEVQGAIITTDDVAEAYTKAETVRAEKEVKLERIRVTAKRIRIKEAKKEQTDWEKAVVASMERIDASFAEAWSGGFASFTEFADKMKEGFRQLMGELAHTLLTRPLVMRISAAVTGALGSGTAAASGGFGASGVGGISSLFSGGGFTAMGRGLYSGLGDMAGQAGFLNVSSALQAKGAGLTGLGMAGDIGGGIVGGYLGSKAFGPTSGVGATLGGIAGSVAIPIPVLGAAIGSFLGSGLESLLGGDNNGDNKAGAKFDLGTGRITGNTWGNSPGDPAGAVALAEQLKVIADSIGGSSYKGNLAIGANDGIEFAGQKFGQDTAKFFAEAFKKIVGAGTVLSQPIKDLITGFKGASEQGIVFAQSLLAIDQLSSLNTAKDAIDAFNAEIPTIAEAYTIQTNYLVDMIAAYDGTAEAAADVSRELIVNKQAAAEFAVSIKQIGKSLSEAAAEQANTIRESVLSPSALKAKREAERDSLRSSLGTLADPQKIADAERRILELNRQLFDAIPDELQKTQAEAFAKYAEETAAITAQQLETIAAGLVNAQTDINQLTSDMLYNNAKTQTDNTAKQSAAIDKFAAYIQKLSEQGIAITIDGVQVAEREVSK